MQYRYIGCIIKAMETYINLKEKIKEEQLKNIGKEIRSGKLVIFPTETVYGIGTNGLNAEAVKKIYHAKGRDFKNPINLLIDSIEMVEKLAQNISPLEYKLMKAFFPGPFTLILKKKDIVPNIVTGNSDTVGVRMPNNYIAQKLITYAGVPIAAPSANISGKLSGTKFEDIFDDFKNKVDYIIDGGQSSLGMESTIVKVIDGIPHILRPGSITPEQIKSIAGNVIIESQNLPSNNLKHYQINSKALLVYGKDILKVTPKIKEISLSYDFPVIITYSENISNYKGLNVIELGSKYNLKEVSKNMFNKIRQAELLNPDIIIIEGIEQDGIGLAIMNRLLNICNSNFILVK